MVQGKQEMVAKTNIKKGIFITMEGGEGCGKTTHCRLLADYLKKRGIPVLLTRQPGGTEVGKKIRNILLQKDADISALCELFLYLADRAEHVQKVIIPALNKGWVVISDRYSDATLVYQGYGRLLDKRLIVYLNRIASMKIKPDLTFFLDISSKAGLKKVHKRGKIDRMEKENISFHEKVRQGYLALAGQQRKRIKRIKVKPKILQTHKEILRYLKPYLEKLCFAKCFPV